jgi:AAA family ATP:ADP antiporter
MKRGTWEPTSWVAVAVFLMTASLILTKTGRDALFFQDEGLFDLPKAYIGIALLAGPTAFLTLFLMRRVGPRLARVIVPLVVAAGLVWFSFEAQPGGGAFMTLFFMAVPLVFGVMFSLSWLLAADLLDHLQGSEVARPYSAIGAASIMGGILGGLSARILAPRIEPPLFLVLGGLTLAASAFVMMAAQSRYPVRPAAADARTGPPEPHPIRALMGQRYVVILAMIAIAGSLTGVLIEFQFFLAAASSGNTGQENAALFANLYTVLNAGALLVQLLLVPELQKWIGVGGSLLVLPGALVAGTTAMLASSSVLARSALRAAEGGLKSSVHRSNWEQAFLPIASAGRSIAKVLIDGLGARLGEGLAAGVLFVWLAGLGPADLADLSTTWLNILLVGVALTWLGLSRRLGRSPCSRRRRKRAEMGGSNT